MDLMGYAALGFIHNQARPPFLRSLVHYSSRRARFACPPGLVSRSALFEKHGVAYEIAGAVHHDGGGEGVQHGVDVLEEGLRGNRVGRHRDAHDRQIGI